MTEFNPPELELVYCTYLGGSSTNEYRTEIAVDRPQSAYVVGNTPFAVSGGGSFGVAAEKSMTTTLISSRTRSNCTRDRSR